MNKNLNKITSLEENFSQWYTDLIVNGNLINYGVVKGAPILKPHGYAIWKNIVKNLEIRFLEAEIQDVYMPLLIPESLLNQEKEHIQGFAPECAIVTKVGDKNLDEPLVIRPTSEVLFGTYFSKNISSYKDLPLKYNQWANVIRWEKTTRPFLRTTEFLWQEGHSVHNNMEEAQNWTVEMMNLYVKFFKEVLAIAVLNGKKSLHEKFAGAVDTYSLEALMLDGQALQSATSHYFAQNFSKNFDIKFTNANNKEEYGYQTSWGMSTRVIGALIMSHSDNSGVVLPPMVAPIQVGIIPIQDDEQVRQQVNRIYQQLKTKYRVVINNSLKSLGYKLSNSEIQGVCFRIEIGIRELETDKVLIMRRDTKTKLMVKINDVESYLKTNMEQMQNDLYAKSLKRLEAQIFIVNSFNEYEQQLKTKTGFFGAWFCNRIECEAEIKQLTSTVSRCQDLEKQVEENSKCFKCNQRAKGHFYFARAY
ncbi:proline--tRNA ligase [Spiroplasma endosymbiont of Eupeodes luniger]|uniref:proline--tRNA ligase n=1 Tax=Spiroplasma endosymbiont of Eupeodes luniger TaxID=3066300 RepID=UPI0030D13C6A